MSTSRTRRSMPGPLKFNVFGRIMVVEPVDGGWELFVLGTDGKRQRSEVVIPPFVKEHELTQYLDDIFHEMATRERPGVVPLPQ